ncbi:hypothetical protein FB451DRAFT_1394162 [Mycena latifolia]|nr:hypothetical protein FB451DRAFT_1394162 [Mycena latifolia]
MAYRNPRNHFFYHPYKPSQSRFNVARQAKFLSDAIHGRRPLSTTDEFRIENRDPPVSDMQRYQEELFEANRLEDWISFARAEDNDGADGWRRGTAYVLPHTTLSTGVVKFTAPSGYVNLPSSFMPLCPHYGNRLRSEAECRMSIHTHLDSKLGRIYYLQVDPKRYHHCPFILLCPKRDSISSLVKPEPGQGLRAMQTHRHRQPAASSSRIKLEDVPTPSIKLEDTSRPAGSSSRFKVEEFPYSSASSCSSSRFKEESALRRLTTPPTVIEIPDDPPARTSRHNRPRPRAISPSSSRGRRSALAVNCLFSPAEAERNRNPSQAFLQKIRSIFPADFSRDVHEHILADENSAEFPLEFQVYRANSEHRNRVLEHSTLTATDVGRFIRRLTSTYGVPSATFDLFKSIVLTCHCCGNFFTPNAFNAHLALENHAGQQQTICRANPLRHAVNTINIPQPNGFLPECTWPVGRRPGQIYAADFTEHLHTPTGIAFLAVNTPLGVPEDIWYALLTAVFICETCVLARTLPAHAAHLKNGVCQDIGPHDVSVILTAKGKGKALGPAGDLLNVFVVDDSESEDNA